MLFYPFGQEWQYDNGVNSAWWQFYNSFSRWNASMGFDLTPNRKYSPTLGRWMTPDPSGMAAASPSNPQTWNMYAYVLNNPTSFYDTSGLLQSTIPDNGATVDPSTVYNLVKTALEETMFGPVTTAVGAGGGGPSGSSLRRKGQSFSQCMQQNSNKFSLGGAAQSIFNKATGKNDSFASNTAVSIFAGNGVSSLLFGAPKDQAASAGSYAPKTIGAAMGAPLTYGRRTTDIFDLNL